MPGRKRDRNQHKPKLHYRVVQQSYEDKEYEQAPKPVLVPAEKVDRPRPRVKPNSVGPNFGDSALPPDFTNKRNMLMPDDTAEGDEEGIFDEEYDAEFDADFIRQMMLPQKDENDSEERCEDRNEEREAAKHKAEAHRSLERQFERAMLDFAADEDLDEEDPRAQGPLQVLDYSAALAQFAEENAGETFFEDDDPARHRGFINQLKALSREHNIFDSNQQGEFVLMMPNKSERRKADFNEDRTGLRQLALEQVRSAGGLAETELPPSDEEAERERLERARAEGRMDCETVLTTYSTLYNHPNIISAESAAKKKKKPQPGPKTTTEKAKESADSEDEPDDEEAELIADDDPRLVRHPNETAEQKAERRKLVKLRQSQRRQEKKSLKLAYRAAHIDLGHSAQRSKQERAQVSLSAATASAQ